MPKFRKIPVVVDAVQWHFGDKVDGVVLRTRYGIPRFDEFDSDREDYYCIDTLEGEMRVSSGDWIITGVKGERYACKPDIFEMTYAPV